MFTAESATDGAPAADSETQGAPARPNRRATYTVSSDWLANEMAAAKEHEQEQCSGTPSRAKLVLTSDLASTDSTRQPLKEALMTLLGEPPHGHHEALWIHDARSGWDDKAVARSWMMDGFDELDWMRECGITNCAGLWINRDFRQSSSDGMLLATRLERSFFQSYEPADVQAVKQVIDGASLLYLPGGNPFRLLDALRENAQGAQVWQHALTRIRAGELTLITRSAGTIVAGATVDISTERPTDWSGDPTGLCVAPAGLAFIPHCIS